MSTVAFKNRGLIDPRCISTIGVSVKEGENPIGFFGTGLKYAIAIVLRNGGTVEVWRGTELLAFDTAPIEVRGAEFSIVRMNGVELGFTTELGKHWQVWQAFREIYCNTIDEGGHCAVGELAFEPEHTTVIVRLEEFAKCFQNIGEYILQTQPVMKRPEVEFHPGTSASVFYRSIRVADHPKPWLFTPNILSKVDLTEDRTLRETYSLAPRIARAVLESTDAAFIEQWLTAPMDHAEHELDLNWTSVTPSDVCLNVMEMLHRDPSRPLNRTVVSVLVKHRKAPEPEAADLFPTEAAALKKAIAFCHALKYRVDEFPITVVESLGQSIMGRADTVLRCIYIARETLQGGTTYAAVTLIEEWAHIKHGFKDCDRPMQNWLFNQVGRLGEAYLYELNSNERHTEEPHDE